MSYNGASVDVPRLSSEFGSGRGGWGPKGNIVRENLPITSNAVDAVIAIATSPTSPRAVTVQINNADGSPISHAQQFRMFVLADIVPLALAVTGGSTGMAADAAHGFIAATPVAKKIFDCFTDATGSWTGSWTDTAHEVAFLGVVLPSGRLVVSGPLTTA